MSSEFATIAALAPPCFGVTPSRLALLALRRHWHIRDRLIVSYVFIAVVPSLLAIFAEMGAWVLSSRSAPTCSKRRWTAASALSKHRGACPAPVAQRRRPQSGFISRALPGQNFVGIRAAAGPLPRGRPHHRPPKIRDRSGVVVKDGHIFGRVTSAPEVVVLAPITRSFLRGLSPFGDVTSPASCRPGRAPRPPPRPVPSLAIRPWRPRREFLDSLSNTASPCRLQCALMPKSRPCSNSNPHLGVINALHQQQWREQTLLLELLVLLAIIFILVELLAAFVGISMTRAITAALQNLYAGTERIKQGDFAHRIEVKGRDQLAELGRSFNAMTENLERLLRSEKERQRLQAELEIAREVQSQLHPREIPALGSLRLASVCSAASMVSGDYYDYQAVSDRHLAIALGDVEARHLRRAADGHSAVGHAQPVEPLHGSRRRQR